MKTKVCLLIVLISFCHSGFALQITDYFNDGTIDSGLWNVSLPFGTSQVFETGGSAVLVSRGGLNTLASFPDSVDILGRFQFAGSLDHFRIVFRSDLSFNDPFMGKSGMIVVFGQDGEVQIGEAEISTLALGTFNPNGWIDFRITDDGSDVNLFVADLTTPLLTASSSYRTGDKVGFYNREFSGTMVNIDSLQISTQVPDAGSTLLLSAISCGGIMGLIQLHRKRAGQPLI